MKAEVSTVGIIGGGQLGMFLAQACQKIGLITHISVSYTHLTLPTKDSV